MIGACWVMLCTWTSSHVDLRGYFCSTRYQLHSSETWSDDPMVAVRKLPTVMVYKAPATRIREEHVSGLGARPRARLDGLLRRKTYVTRLRGFKLPFHHPQVEPTTCFHRSSPDDARDRSRAQELGSSPFLLLYPRAGRGGAGRSRNTGIAAGTWTRTRSTRTWAHGSDRVP